MSLTEILAKAGLNTLLGMGTVFIMLIVISAIISLLRFIPEPAGVQNAAGRKPGTEEAPAASEEAAADKDVLIAVITAAIAAAKAEERKRSAAARQEDTEMCDADTYIVRSVKRIRKSQ